MDAARIFVLIYAPDLEHGIIGRGSSPQKSLSDASSYSNIGREEVESAILPPEPTFRSDEREGTSSFFRTLYTEAQSLVDSSTMIMPFSTPTGHVHIVRHLSPDLAYIQESLTGKEGELVHHIAGWVRQVVVVAGDDSDSEDESTFSEGGGEKWWAKQRITGVGKRIDVIDSIRIGEDLGRRIRRHG